MELSDHLGYKTKSGRNESDPEVRLQQASFARIAPFALYMAFIALEGGLRFISDRGIIAIPNQVIFSLYPVKALSVALLLFFYRKSYTEIVWPDLRRYSATLVSIATGIVVFVFWIYMDLSFSVTGHPPGFDPNVFGEGTARISMMALRLAGAVLVVPVMEELFWRSFLIRYIISPADFAKVPLGQFTWPSFLVTVVLFGFEHHLFLAGMMAGIFYNLLLYRTRSISHCILAHAVTNLCLGIYVINTGQWYFW